MRPLIVGALLIAVLAPGSVAHAAQGVTVPGLTSVGQCASTTIKLLTAMPSPVTGSPDGGTTVTYDNGAMGVSFDVDEALQTAKVGDKVQLCLTSVPSNCPPDDSRGKFYKAIDRRTGKSWELSDAEHMCGGG